MTMTIRLFQPIIKTQDRHWFLSHKGANTLLRCDNAFISQACDALADYIAADTICLG